MDNRNLSLMVAARTLTLLDERKARLYPERTSFYVWTREDRAVVIFDTNMIDIGKINADFAHRLSTRLQGRRVVRTNSRGLYLQVGYEIPPALVELNSMPLDLSKQPTPYHLPIGTSHTGQDIWIDLQEGDSFLVAGARGMGKSGLIHSFVQALRHGGMVEVYGYDGKRGVEFGRYADAPNFTLVTRLVDTLKELKTRAIERRKTLLASGCPNVIEFNKAQSENAMMPIAIIIDEAALTSDEEKALLVEMVERERDTGFHPIIATNRPEASALLMKSNLVTRISFAVPSWNASQMALGMNGAEALDKVQGRGLLVFKARVMEFQSFRVTYPTPSPAAVEKMLLQDEQQAETVPTVVDKTARILELDAQGKSMTQIMKAVWGSNGGGRYDERAEIIRSVLAKKGSSSSTSTPEMPQNGLLEAV
jgi:energy-coupling factor transporter ATP-binding protein EcfA2